MTIHAHLMLKLLPMLSMVKLVIFPGTELENTGTIPAAAKHWSRVFVTVVSLFLREVDCPVTVIVTLYDNSPLASSSGMAVHPIVTEVSVRVSLGTASAGIPGPTDGAIEIDKDQFSHTMKVSEQVHVHVYI